eukprot:1876546-Rhodomonas_salina.1
MRAGSKGENCQWFLCRFPSGVRVAEGRRENLHVNHPCACVCTRCPQDPKRRIADDDGVCIDRQG